MTMNASGVSRNHRMALSRSRLDMSPVYLRQRPDILDSSITANCALVVHTRARLWNERCMSEMTSIFGLSPSSSNSTPCTPTFMGVARQICASLIRWVMV